MPIEIRELVIRATIGAEGDGASRPASDVGPGALDGRPPALDVEALVQECVRQVLRVLARDKER